MNQDSSPLGPLLDEFAHYLVAKWKEDFEHRFPISRHHAWNSWRNHPASGATDFWFCASLYEASDRYSWQAEAPAEWTGELQEALHSHDAVRAFEVCKQIFRWGGVARSPNNRSRLWIHNQGKELPQKIRCAVNLLKDPTKNLAVFNGTEFLMNSAMTKIYWAADEAKQLVIYDGRVGAALGLLARGFLKSRGLSIVPDELKFLWGASRDPYVIGIKNKRNPSESSLVFPALFSPARNDYGHATMVRRASHLLQRVAEMLGANVSVLDLEKAFFMVGYDVRHWVHT
ncbi:MAG: hypothetical protein WCK17_07715 [Verrucomicrobiota bacterium]